MVRTFDDEVKALEDYGHDCCARIDDRIHECCRRIREAHEQELDSTRCAYEISMALMEKQPSLVTYDVLDNERHKAICKLREMSELYPNKDGGADLYAWKSALADAIGADTELFSAIRDRLIHLLGGDQPTLSELFGILREDDDGVDARPSDSASADSPVHGSAGCGCGGACDCDGEELLAPITTELRDRAERYCNFKDDTIVKFSEEEFDCLCDNIDAIHAGLERDYKVACEVNEHQDLEYTDLAERCCKIIIPPLGADGLPINIGDVMEWPDGDDEPFEVVGIGENGTLFYMYDDSCEWTNAKNKVHHAPTVEEVLREMLDAWGELPSYATDEAIVAEYAVKLKLANS